MSEGLSTRASSVLRILRAGKEPLVDGWYAIGRMEGVGRITVRELLEVPELEFCDVPNDISTTYVNPWYRVKVRFREQAPAKPAGAGDDRVVVLLAEILAVLRDRL